MTDDLCAKHGISAPSPEACPGCRWEAEVGELRGSLEGLMKAHDATVLRQQETIARLSARLEDLVAAARRALRGLEDLSRQEAERSGSTFKHCDYTFAKGLRASLARVDPMPAKEGR